MTSMTNMISTRFRFGSVAILLALASAGCSTSTNTGLPIGTVAGDSDLSPFYRWQEPLSAASGTLLREEKVSLDSNTPHAGERLRLLHASTDVRWDSGQIPVSGILYMPSGDPPSGGWPLLAWGHGTLGVADVCAPSWTGHRDRDAAYIDQWLKAGFAVVATDYQGLGGPGPHPYLYWQAEGRSMLDSARAALAARPGSISNQVILAGQSQGAGAALGAAALAGDYAPDLNVLGTIATGPNSTYPEGPVSLPDRNSGNMFLSIVSGGLNDEAPPVEELLNSAGLQLLEVARTGCSKELGEKAQELETYDLEDAFTVSLDQLTEMRIPVTDRPLQTIGIPYEIVTGMSDHTVSPRRQYAVVAALCASNNKVRWSRYEGLDHDDALNGSFEGSLAFARDVLKGNEFSSGCEAVEPIQADADEK